jgi:hypothetical protein
MTRDAMRTAVCRIRLSTDNSIASRDASLGVGRFTAALLGTLVRWRGGGLVVRGSRPLDRMDTLSDHAICEVWKASGADCTVLVCGSLIYLLF